MNNKYLADRIDITSLIDFARGNPHISHMSDPEFADYKNLYQSLLEPVPEVPGWYLWYNGPENIYVGRTKYGITSSLRARLAEEFFDESAAIWATVHDPKKVEDELCRKNLAAGKKEYRGPIRRSIRKRGTTAIFWCGLAGVGLDVVVPIEKYLIYELQPTANIQGKRKPAPSTPIGIDIISQFQK